MKQLWLAVVLSSAVILAAEADAREGQGADGSNSYATRTPNLQLAVSSHSQSDRALLREIQNRLITLGYDPGPADGLMGWQTRRAIRNFQERANLRVDGEPSGLLLDRLRAAVALSSKPRHKQRQVKKPPATNLERLVQQLTYAIRQAENRRRAEPAFLAELAGILRPYQRPKRRPKRREVLRENFSDGNFTTNPTWTVISGDFRVSRHDGLVSRVNSGRRGDRRNDTSEDIVADMLTQILTRQQQQRPPESRPEAAVISTRVGFGNNFELKASLQVRGDSVCDIGVFDSIGQGYVLSLSGGRSPVLIRRAGGRTEIISRSNSRRTAPPETVYDFRWTRDPGGDMQVQLAEGAEIGTNDHVLGDNFDGVVHSNRSGKCVLRAISVIGTF